MNTDYDVALSFAGEDRKQVEQLALELLSQGIKVFYDEFEQANLWGKDLYQYLSEVYYSNARYCVVFISEHYSRKLWTNHELRSAQARAFEQNSEYILPLKLDDTQVPGIHSTIGYIDLRIIGVKKVAEMIITKLGYKTFKVHPSLSVLPIIPNIALPNDLIEDINAICSMLELEVFTDREIDRKFLAKKDRISVEVINELKAFGLLDQGGYLTESGISMIQKFSSELSKNRIENLLTDRSNKVKLIETINYLSIPSKVRTELIESINKNDELLYPVIKDLLYEGSSINSARRFRPVRTYHNFLKDMLGSIYDMDKLVELTGTELYSFLNSSLKDVDPELIHNFFIKYGLMENHHISKTGFINIYEAIHELEKE
ncbi:toll/interleukin-1 receptor domain-containing protein [Paenibacillus sp. FSL H7-0331]|uniref:toll/interleukin-1 receptor domain-containing protein n=1 Tax=Paenibacillus sp. FSL H7-0331 TaxID=1920421 RepID=UPI00096D3D64|nr:TIR domain-containing protein [Paenibacillus sp. FSL H7-0331]OMF02633.1 hypothetical protein BK127_37125 [Paenibacillus sp. FSL H7-0331]